MVILALNIKTLNLSFNIQKCMYSNTPTKKNTKLFQVLRIK